MNDTNPLLADWDTPYGLPPFDKIKPEHFPAAFDAAMAAHRSEVAALAGNPAAPDFANTVAAWDRSGRAYNRIAMVFGNLCSTHTSEALQAVERDYAPKMAVHQSALFLDAALFRRIEAVYAARLDSGLKPEQVRLVERVHLDFVRAGARLDASAKQRYQAIVERLAEICTLFGQHVLADESSWQLILKDEADLAGLPDSLRAAARQAAVDRGVGDAWVITLSRSLVEPFLSCSTRRDLREQAWRAWNARGEMSGERDTRPLIKEIMQLRQEQARLHGYATYADFALVDRMAKTPAAAAGLLTRVWQPALAKATAERRDLEALAAARGEKLAVDAWDWRYWAEQLRIAAYQLDDAEIKPYFRLDAMIQAMFDCAGRLFGIRFEEKSGIPLYHPDARIWEVREIEGGKLKGIFIGDNFARASKRSGAWMSNYREQSRNTTDGSEVIPIVSNNNNFAKGEAGTPTLLSFDDVNTLFHEFGHGLHGLLSDSTYERLAGTNVLTDFVELPSQLFEHWALEPEVLARHARHWKTGESIPAALVEKIKATRTYGQGFKTVQYLGPALIDMALHLEADPATLDPAAFEAERCRELGVPSEVGLRHRLPHFLHLFTDEHYAAGYYVYMWAEVLEADAWQAFVEAGDPFDPVVAARLKQYIYSAGNARDPAEAYRLFRGRDPQVEALLVQRGLV